MNYDKVYSSCMPLTEAIYTAIKTIVMLRVAYRLKMASFVVLRAAA